ncbi:MAG: ribosome-associated translation inhibitor RaiA [Bacteroidota bacterium]|nr:ribosome-associated translation inhibitor RaiA [Bacteroidota bacterium]MDP4229227.1 ribosome-associated translation inhibitor RaiA [Bacteroidota bacterium]MDP4236054.1 ribosome-associated translation inhibitor RaiA [Bacteroidota bacterium]
MNIQISNRHESADGHIKTFVENELATLQSKYEILGADVILDREGHANVQYSAEINLKVRGTTLHAKESSEDVGKSIDLVVKTLEKQLKKHRDLQTTSPELIRKAIEK